MRILYYSPHPHLRLNATTGYGTHMREMIAAWRKKGIEVKTLIAGDLQEESQGVQSTNKTRSVKRVVPRLIWETMKDFGLLRFDQKLEKLLKKAVDDFKPDFIYERVAYMQNSGVKVAKSCGIKHVSEFNAPYPDERLSLSGSSLLLRTARDNQRQILIQSNHISVVSQALKAHFETLVPGTASRTVVIPNCVNPVKTGYTSEKVETLRRTHQLEGQRVIGFVGSIFPYHGVDLLIQAFAKLGDRKNLKLLIVGDGQVIPDLKAQALRLGVLGDIIFTGSVPHTEVYAHIDLMDICCLTRNKWYMSPVKLFEYGLMEKPVLASDASAVRDVMDDMDGTIVRDEVTAFCEGLEKLIKNESLRNQLAKSWHKKVLKNHTWDTAANKILEICA